MALSAAGGGFDGTERAGTGSRGRKQDRNSADGCGEDRAVYLRVFCQDSIHSKQGRIQPAGLGGGPTGRAPNLTYPQNRISPRISATLFWKSEKNKN